MHSSRLQSLFKRLINQFKTFCCCLLTAGPQSKCGHCYCKQASKTRYVPCIQERFTERCCIFMRRVTTFSYSKLLSPTSNNQTHNISPSSPPLPSVFTSLCPSWHGVFVSLVLWQLGSCGVQLTFRSSRIPPQGSAPPLRITDPVWGNRTDAGPGRWRTSPRSYDIHAARYCTDSHNQRQDEFIRKSCLSGQKSHESGGGKTTSTCAPSAPEL